MLYYNAYISKLWHLGTIHKFHIPLRKYTTFKVSSGGWCSDSALRTQIICRVWRNPNRRQDKSLHQAQTEDGHLMGKWNENPRRSEATVELQPQQEHLPREWCLAQKEVESEKREKECAAADVIRPPRKSQTASRALQSVDLGARERLESLRTTI